MRVNELISLKYMDLRAIFSKKVWVAFCRIFRLNYCYAPTTKEDSCALELGNQML